MSATAEPNSHQLGSRMSLKSGPATTWLVHSNVSQLTYVSILFPRSGSLLPLETPAERPYILPVPFAGLTSTRTEVTGTALIGSPRPLNLLSFLAPSASGSHIHERAGSRFRESISAVGLTAKICDRIALPGVRHWCGPQSDRIIESFACTQFCRAVDRQSARARWHHEGHVARERAAARYHLYFTGDGARGYGGRDFGTRHHGEASRRAVEGDAGGAGQISSQYVDGRSRSAGTGLCFNKRTKA